MGAHGAVVGERLEPTRFDEELEEVRRGLELDVLDAVEVLLDRVPARRVEQERSGPANRRVAERLDSLRPDRGKEPDLDRGRDVEVASEAAGEEYGVEFSGSEPKRTEEDRLSAGIGGLRLGEVAGVDPRERDARAAAR